MKASTRGIGIGSLAAAAAVVGFAAFSAVGVAQEPGPEPRPREGGMNPRFDRMAPGQDRPMMPMMGGMQGGGGGGAIMIDDNDNLYVLRGGTVFKIAKRDLAIKAQTQLPGGPPPGQRMPEMRRGEMMPPGGGGREAPRPPREGNPFDDGN